ncbi:YceI family protein [Silvibacterium sp.]|uniref:YceI family protein n=1 Tax=Silvibacterium sp. TaxID=1964179 RepID=UPI0039E2C081
MKAYRTFLLLLAFGGVTFLSSAGQTPASVKTPASGNASGQPVPQKITVHLDPAKTEIHWTVSTALHTVHGTFSLKGGLITIDPSTGEAQGEVIVETASGQSGNKSRDAKMQKEILESEKYPEAIFHPEKVTGSLRTGSQQKISIGGLFTIHGGDHPLTLEMDIDMKGSDATATTHFAVPYVQWGMKDPSSFFTHVSKEVKVDVAARGTVDGV